jgi:hypothetical protein
MPCGVNFGKKWADGLPQFQPSVLTNKRESDILFAIGKPPPTVYNHLFYMRLIKK